MRIKKRYSNSVKASKITCALCRGGFDATRRGSVVTLTTIIAVDLLICFNDWVIV